MSHAYLCMLRLVAVASASAAIVCISACTLSSPISKKSAAPIVDTELSGAGPLHVASPDWRDQIIYFAMIDRFDDGDSRNNDQGAGEFDPTDNARYSGGDLAGLERRVDYIRELGATALWITPPVAHRWWDEVVHYGGYHGYWADNLVEVDAHFGTLADYQRLSRRLHASEMYLVQDIVVNHMGNYFSWPQRWSANDPTDGFVLNPDRNHRSAPTQWPFSQNDVRDPVQRNAAIYHWTPTITDYRASGQEQRYQLADLDDLNTENPTVRDALRDNYGYWIEHAGVDAYRVDTAFYVPAEFFDDFLHNDSADHPGILRIAQAHGRKDFHLFGEGFGIDKPYDDTQARKIDGYMRDADGRALLPGMINFPLYGSLGDVFARGHPSAELAYRIENMMTVHADPYRMPSFIDNHDVDRFLASGSEAALRQALLAMLTLPGIPTIYYGTEQAFTGQRAAMFRSGFQSNRRDHFDVNAPMYRYLQRAIALRREHRLFSRGTPTVLASNAASAGVLAYRMQAGNEAALVVFNTSDGPVLLDNLDSGVPVGSILTGMFAINDTPSDLLVDAGGRIHKALDARAGMVWKIDSARQPTMPVVSAPTPRAMSIDSIVANVSTDFDVSGSAPEAQQIAIVVDGDLAQAQTVRVDSNGRWQARVDTASMVDPAVVHRVVAWDERHRHASPARMFQVSRHWSLRAEVIDPIGDDHGPTGSYRYPEDPGWGAHRQLDLHRVRVFSSGGAMKIEIVMNDLTDSWNPSNGFDHVAFTIAFALPERHDGVAVLPLQNVTMPEQLRWQYRLRAHGWSNAWFASDGATARQEGIPKTPGARIDVEHDRNTLTFTLPAASFGHLTSLSGIRLYVTTWDYDGGFKPLSDTKDGRGFSGGDANDPLVMDDVLIAIP